MEPQLKASMIASLEFLALMFARLDTKL